MNIVFLLTGLYIDKRIKKCNKKQNIYNRNALNGLRCIICVIIVMYGFFFIGKLLTEIKEKKPNCKESNTIYNDLVNENENENK